MGVLPAEDPELMAEDEDLKILRAVIPASVHEEAGQCLDEEGDEEEHRGMLEDRLVKGTDPGFRPPRACVTPSHTHGLLFSET
jgi:hypothetical protein